jgi:phage shock protein PspC (stress-responsive transcriptional regulator)
MPAGTVSFDDRVMTTTDAPLADSRRLTRPREGRIVAGVCAGAADYFDIDPVIFRVVLAVLAVFGGAGLVIYAAGWLLIPETGDPNTRLERWLTGHGDRRRDILIVAGVLLVLLMLSWHNAFVFRISGAFVLVALVMGVAALLGRRRYERRAVDLPPRTSTPPPPSSPPTYGPAPQPASASAYAAGYPSAYEPTAEWAAAPEPAVEQAVVVKPRRPRSWLGWLIVGAMLIVAGTLGIVGMTGIAHPQPADVLAAAVAVLGIGLVIGGFWGRARLMILVGVLLVGMLAVADGVPRNLTWTAGNRTWTPTAASLGSSYVLGAGDAKLDLTGVGTARTATVDSRIGAGRLLVIVPRGTGVSVHATNSGGRIVLFGHESDGSGLDAHWSIAPRPGAGTLTLNLQAGYGDVEVRNAAA